MCARIGDTSVKRIIVVQRDGDTENIRLMQGRAGIGIVWNIFEEPSCAGSHGINDSKITEEGGDTWILRIRFQIFRSYVSITLGTASILHVHFILHNDKFGHIVARKFTMDKSIGNHLSCDDA